MAKYCSQCGAKISFRSSFTIDRQPVCGSCMIERIASGGKALPKNKVKKVSVTPKEDVKKTKVLPKDKVKSADKRKRDEHSEKKQKSLGWVMITGCLVPSISTGIIFTGYDLKGLIPLIALAIYISLLTLLSGSIIWSVEKIMKPRHDYSLHKMHFASNLMAIIAVIVTIILAYYLYQGDIITKISKFKEKLIFAGIMLIVAYFSYISPFFINRIKFGWKQKKKKKIISKKKIKAKNKPRSSTS